MTRPRQRSEKPANDQLAGWLGIADVGIDDLQVELKLVQKAIPERPGLEPDELFVTWFLTAYFVEDPKDAAKRLTGITGDRGTDAVYVDQRTTHIVQGKFRKKFSAGYESQEEIDKLLNLGKALVGTPQQYQKFLTSEQTHPLSKEAIESARDFLRNRRNFLQLHYVTTGRVSKSTINTTFAKARKIRRLELNVVDGRNVLALLEDYITGYSPKLGKCDIQLKHTPGVRVSKPLQRKDEEQQIESWLLTTTGDQLAELYSVWNDRLFALNVRGYKGKSEVNNNIGRTIRTQPQNFWYYNNGVTILCERVAFRKNRTLTLIGPQVINGQQTTRELYNNRTDAKNVDVLLKIIKVPRDEVRARRQASGLVKNIVEGSNWQNKMTNVDLKSNDPRLVRLEKSMRPLGYFFQRKTMPRNEARRVAGKGRQVITNLEAAYAVTAIDIDPALIIRPGEGGKNVLFGKRFTEVFHTLDAYHYLTRFWVMRGVIDESKRHSDGAAAKWFVLRATWNEIGAAVSAPSRLQDLRGALQRKPARTEFNGRVRAAAKPLYKAAREYYRRNARTDDGHRLSASAFFKVRADATEFQRFWKSSMNKAQHKRVRVATKRLRTSVKKLVDEARH